MRSFRRQATRVIRGDKNAHRFICFIDGRIRTFATRVDDINSPVAALFGALNDASPLRGLAAGVLLTLALAFSPPKALALDPMALPTGYQSVSGNHQFSQGNGVLNVSTGASRSIVNYASFNIGRDARVNFNLPSSSASILNRVTGGGMSEIYGTMSSNGKVFLVNPAGIFFGNGANVSVNGLVASTLSISDQQFLAGQYQFSRVAGSAPGHIQIEPGANINILNGGSSTFLASSFANHGAISAPGGTIQVGIGDRVTLGDDLIGINVTAPLKDTLDRIAIVNTGHLTASQVKFLASTLKQDVLDTVVNNSGRISANKVVDGAGGVVELIADNGLVDNAGVIDAGGVQGGKIVLQGQSAKNSGELLATGTQGAGGDVHVLGSESVGLTDNALVDVSGRTGGGSVLIGGDYKGENPLIQNALYTYVGENARIHADALGQGNGGRVIVWGNEATAYAGEILARGGTSGGNGGFVETSGKNWLSMQGRVDAGARHSGGRNGVWLLDPRDVSITNDNSFTLPLYDLFSDTLTFNPISILILPSEIKAGSINTALNAGTDVIVHTGNYGIQQGDIRIKSAILKSSGGSATLSLFAADDITLDSTGSIESTANNPLHLVLRADHDIFDSNPSNGSGRITLNSDILLKNGNVTLSGQAIDLNKALKTGGNVTLTALGGNIAQNAATSILAGNGLIAEANGNTRSISLKNADFKTATLTTNNGQVDYVDSDGVTATVNSGAATAKLTTFGGNSATNDASESNLTLTDANAANTFDLTANQGDITQANGSTINGVNLSVSTNAGNVKLERNNANDVDTLTATSKSGNVTYRDKDGITLGAVNLNTDNNGSKGNLSVQAQGSGGIDQTGALVGVNTLTVQTDNGDVNLANDGNDANNLQATSRRGNVTYHDTNGINIAGADLDSDSSGVQGNLTIQANGAGNITQSGAINKVDTLSVTTDTGNATLTHSLNDARHLVASSNQGDVSYRDLNSINVKSANLNQDTNSIRGNLSLRTSLIGDITQSGAITGVNTLKLRTDFGDAYLTLDNNVWNLEAGTSYGTFHFTNTDSFTLTGADMNINNFLWKGDLDLTAKNGWITQSAAINAGELKINGNAILIDPNNKVDVFSAFGSGATVFFLDKNGFNLGRSDVGNGFLSLGTLSGTINQDYYGPLPSLLLQNRNITENGGITAGTLNLNLGSGTSAFLRDSGNTVSQFSLWGNQSCTRLVNGVNLNINNANDTGGILETTLLNGASLTQTGSIDVKALKITLDNGGDFTLTHPGNNVRFLSANATGENTINSQGAFVDGYGGFGLAASDMGNGDLSLEAWNGGNITQAGLNCAAGACDGLPAGGLRADEVKLTLVDSGDADFTTQPNTINVLSANARSDSVFVPTEQALPVEGPPSEGPSGGNTADTQIRFNNQKSLNLAQSDLGEGQLYVNAVGNIDNRNLDGSSRGITSNNSTLTGGLISLQALNDGRIDLYNNITATSAIHLTTANSTGGIQVHPGAIVAAKTGGVYINTDRLTLDGYVQGGLVQIWPWNLSLSMGIAGSNGGMSLSQGLINHINNDASFNLNTVMFGHQDYQGTIILGSLNLAGHTQTNVAFNAPRVFDATPNNDSRPNLIMAANRHVYLTSGADEVANWVSAPGGVSYGDNSSFFSDLDINISGGGLIHVRLVDFTGVGDAFAILTGGDYKAFINAQNVKEDSGSLKNLASTLSGRASSQIINQIKGGTIVLPGNSVNNQPSSFGVVHPVQFIPNQSL
jgi:filamentous hemagglutinin family protein